MTVLAFPIDYCGFELRDGVQFFECRPKRTGRTPDRSRPELLVFRLEVEVMEPAGEVLRSFEFALDERFVDDHLGGEVRQFTFLACFHLLRIGSKFRCIRSTPTERQSTSENDFECFASTGVNTP